MRKAVEFFTIFLFLTSAIQAQSLQIFDRNNGANITGANIEIQSTDNHGWAGYESLDLAIKVVNQDSGSIVVGAKKIEHDAIQSDVDHTICFALNCYPPTVYVSPSHATLTGVGDADSSFIAHFLFDNRVHIRGINHVSYVFYDVNNPSDSVVVHVTYNTVVLVGLQNNTQEKTILHAFPNPANEAVSLQFSDKNMKKAGAMLVFSNSKGEQVLILPIPANPDLMTINVSKLAADVYSVGVLVGEDQAAIGKIIVVH